MWISLQKIRWTNRNVITHQSKKKKQNRKSNKKPKNRSYIMTILDSATTHLENTNIPSTNNKIENIFQKIFLKHIKRTIKI